MKTFVFGLLALAGVGLALTGASVAQAAEKHSKHDVDQDLVGPPHPARRHVRQPAYVPDPYYDYSYGYYRPLPVYVYGRGPRGPFDFPPNAPGGLLNPEPRPVDQNPQQYMMNQLHDRPFSDDEPY